MATALLLARAAPEEELVTKLGDQITFKTKTYSGYLDASVGKSLHYVFTESQADPAKDPLLIWFNGGPGCSSLLGFFQENGPWVVYDETGTIFDNADNSWNRRANVMYLESPAGVGFSTAATDADWNHTDMSQSVDAFFALQKWYEKFPEYKDHPLWISGESYGGIYVPYLSW